MVNAILAATISVSARPTRRKRRQGRARGSGASPAASATVSRRKAEKTPNELMIRLLEQSGGRLTDSIEREMALRLFAQGGFGHE